MSTLSSLSHLERPSDEDPLQDDEAVTHDFQHLASRFYVPTDQASSAMSLPATTASDEELHPFLLTQTGEQEAKQEDDSLTKLASRAFLATCQKFARQRYPEYRRRTPYTFLENWHLHSMYSKSQQILLGIPHAHPIVLLAGDDFMLTPQFIQQQHIERMEQRMRLADEDETDDEQQHYDYYYSSPMDVDDEDVLMVTARAPEAAPIVMDENMWMGRSRHMQTIEEEDFSNNHSLEVLEQQEQPRRERAAGFTMSPEIVHWYRSAQFHQRRPSTILEVPWEEEEEEEEKADRQDAKDEDPVETITAVTTTEPVALSTTCTADTENHDLTSSASYQSLPDMIVPETEPQQDTMVIPINHNECGYGTVAVQDDRPETSQSPQDFDYQWLGQHHLGLLFSISTRIAYVLVTAFECSEKYVEEGVGKASFGHLFKDVFRVWRLLFICAEALLADFGEWILPLKRVTQDMTTQQKNMSYMASIV